MNRAAMQGGRTFEEEWAARIGGKLQPGSGNQWYAKLDVDSLAVLWSLKSTTKRTFPITPALIAEAVDGAQGPGGPGSIPGWAIRLEGCPDLVMFRDFDFFEIVRKEIVVVGGHSKMEERRARADVPSLMR